MAGKTFLDDPSSFKALIQAMPEPERSEYLSYGALSLEACFPSRKMVAYILKDHKPIDIEVITFESLTVDWDTGPSVLVAVTGGKFQVLAVPKRLGKRDVFLHVPQSFTLKYRGRQVPQRAVDFVSHYAVLIKTRSKELHQVEGHTYLVTLNNFRERFPDLKVSY